MPKLARNPQDFAGLCGMRRDQTRRPESIAQHVQIIGSEDMIEICETYGKTYLVVDGTT